MSKHILIVDDSTSVRQLVALALKEQGHTVVEASDGIDALSKLDGTRFHLIISDVNMPNMDGISLLKEVKQKPQYKFTPVLMLTTESGDDKKQAGKEAGAKAWLVKPFKPEVLLAVVAKLA